MAHSASRRGVTNLGIPLMLLSFLLLGGFLYWLNVTAEPTQAIIVEDDTTPEMDTSGATAVEAGALAVSPGQWVGQRIRLADVDVASPVGTQAFFVSLTQQAPFLVKMDSSLVARGMGLPTGQVTVIGTLLAMTDSIIDNWTETGAVTPADRPVVEFATHFILAEQIRTASGSGAGDDSGN